MPEGKASKTRPPLPACCAPTYEARGDRDRARLERRQTVRLDPDIDLRA